MRSTRSCDPMHELAICKALIDQLGTVARNNGATRVNALMLEVGPLSGVVPDQLLSAFPIASAGTLAEDAEITVERAPIRVWCPTCDVETEAAINRLICGKCGNWRTTLRSGNELLLRSVVLEDAKPASPGRYPEGNSHV